MSETLCELRKKGGGGGKYTETSLWTNPSPTTAISSALMASLSDSVDNYKYIKLLYRYSTSDATEYSMIYATDVFKQCQQGTFKAPIVGFTEQATDGSLYARQAYYVGTTSVKFGGTCYILGGTSKDSTKSIPTEILGLNELDHAKGFDETVLWTNPSPNTRMPASDSTVSVTVTLSEALSNYDYVKFVFKRNNSTYADMYSYVIYSVEEFKKYLASTSYAFRGSVSAYTNNTSIQITKKFSYVDDTTVMFVHTMSGTTSAGSYSQIIYDETLIPNQIIGCKFR